jgi:hypothetical protein
MTDQDYANLTDQIQGRGFADDVYADDHLEDITRQLAGTTVTLAALLDHDEGISYDDDLPLIRGIADSIHATLQLRGLLTQRRHEVDNQHGIPWIEHLNDIDRWREETGRRLKARAA